MPDACILIADISGSSDLYEQVGNEKALEQVNDILMRMQHISEQAGGHFVRTKGDDVLSYFESSDQAFQAAWVMINENCGDKLAIHAGLYYGEILSLGGDIYGKAVNTAARLAAMAKPKEILLGDVCFVDLKDEHKKKFLMIGDLPLKGKEALTKVYSCSGIEQAPQTIVFGGSQKTRVSRVDFADISHKGKTWRLKEGEVLTIGRSNDCEMILNNAWVSRNHAVVSIKRGLVEYLDHSSTGSVVQTSTGEEFTVHRRATLLGGEGVVFIGVQAGPDTAEAIIYKTTERGLEYVTD